MIFLSRRLLDRKSLVAGDSLDLADALDFGIFLYLEIVITVHQAGTGEAATLVIQHAPVNETDAYIPFDTAVSMDLTTAITTWFHVASFTRFVAWTLSGTLDSEAVVTVDIIAKG